MKFKYFVLMLTFSLLFVACGKKTDVVSKDTFNIEKVNIDETIAITKDGVVFQNRSNFYLIVKKAAENNGCLTKFEEIARIKPKESFIDKDVVPSKRYVYSVYNYDDKIEVASESVAKGVIYNIPVTVTDFDYKVINDNIIEANIKFSDEIGFYEVYLNSRFVKKSKKEKLNLTLEKPLNRVEITPYDKYFNKGVLFASEIPILAYFTLSEVEGIKYVVKEMETILSWSNVEKAEGYKIYALKDKSEKLVKEVGENFAIIKRDDICKYKITAFNKYFETEGSVVNICD